ncbi:hypothetical protein GCM10025768_10350 [Microbacterium pseudoresistens]|uniref:Glycosyltransferase involved in cell wall biosynthesis n=1 Tax=Microbacterium pseudoresistens TaxID=640634 RepID=A0A7Y9JNV0_9MICO|nr:glycosyltransferase [Microbacterium pseudoresistens]NYD54938.1 glycosyltransferase involved in cell wall biosynthesis [Microbacterium pseudoresistens]
MAQLRLVLDQLVSPVDSDLADASRALLGGLVRTAPSGCDVAAIVPAGEGEELPGVSEVRRLPLARRELSAAWQLGVARGVGAGMIHSPTLLAPLVRHDRVHDHDQIVPTVWDLRAWEDPESLPRAVVMAQRALLRRAVKHADAVVVPTHSLVDRLSSIARLGDRIRVIPGAAAPEVLVGADAAQRRADAGVPAERIVLAGDPATLGAGFSAVAATGLDAVVLDVREGGEPEVSEIASIAGLPEARLHVRGRLSAADRAAVLGGAAAFIATDDAGRWPWRLVEAMALSVPVVAADSDVHRDVLADGGMLVAAHDMRDAVAEATTDARERLSVLAQDRARGFSWEGAADRVWALHAEL